MTVVTNMHETVSHVMIMKVSCRCYAHTPSSTVLSTLPNNQ